MKRDLYMVFGIMLILSLICGCIGNGNPEETTPPASTTAAPTTTLPPETTPPPEGRDLAVGDVYVYNIYYMLNRLDNEDEWLHSETDGTVTIEILPSDGYDYTFHYYGSLVRNGEDESFDVSIELNDEDLYDFIVGSFDIEKILIFNYSSCSPYLSELLTDPTYYIVGSFWNVTVADEEGIMEVTDTCQHAGKEGYATYFEFHPGDATVEYTLCIDPYCPMPLAAHTTYDRPDLNDMFAADLISWEN